MSKYDLDFQRELLWLSSKPLVRRIGRSVLGMRLLSSQFILVLGSQRSGTTLMFLMLTAHPRITGLDENYAAYALPPWPVLAVNALRRRRTVFKLPTVTSQVEQIARSFPHCKIVWMIRHPFAVVASMQSLRFADGLSWLEKFGMAEAESAISWCEASTRPSLQELAPAELAATIWKYKLLTMDRYAEKGVCVIGVLYEELLINPESEMRRLLSELNVAWSENVLEHHRFHGLERHAGATKGYMPIDSTRSAGGDKLDAGQKAQVVRVAGDLMARFGYDS